MAQNEFHVSFVESPARSSTLCASCGQTAELYLSLFEETPQRDRSFCLSCAETLIRDLLRQHAVHGSADLAVADTVHAPFPHANLHHDDAEGGIIFWEGHGWSTDGPFAGA